MKNSPTGYFDHKKHLTRLTFIFVLALYAAASFLIPYFSRSQGVIMILGNPMPHSMLTGVFSSLANICIIFLVVFFRRAGFFTALALLILQFPIMIMNLIVSRSMSSVPGIFSNIFTIIAAVIIFTANNKIGGYQERIHEQATTDEITGLPNRFACTELVGDLIKRNERFALVSVDLNNFKSINDTMGHEFGDRMLATIAERWKMIAEGCRAGTIDYVCSLGGDAFALIICSFHSPEDITHAIRSYEKELERKITLDDCDYYMTACFGYAECPDDADNTGALFSGADAAMHEVKRQRSSSHILHYTPDLTKADRALAVERRIREALSDDTFYYHLQPQYDINHRLRGFEALARLKDTDGSLISPAEFIPIAEKIGVIDQVDSRVFRKSAAFLGEILGKTGADLMLSVNISVRHMMKNNFIDEIRETLRNSGIPASHLEIEITESLMFDSAEKAMGRISEIKELGIRIAIDDFGTGYSSLSYLSSFPADLLKIDKSFIDVMNTGESSRQYVATIVSIGHLMKLRVISEGVENEDQVETLRSIGCDYIQGFVWGRPVPPEEAAQLIG